MCKMMPSPDHFFQNFDFAGCKGGIVPHMIVVFGTHVKNDDISSNVFHFFKIMIFGFSGGE